MFNYTQHSHVRVSTRQCCYKGCCRQTNRRVMYNDNSKSCSKRLPITRWASQAKLIFLQIKSRNPETGTGVEAQYVWWA